MLRVMYMWAVYGHHVESDWADSSGEVNYKQLFTSARSVDYKDNINFFPATLVIVIFKH